MSLMKSNVVIGCCESCICVLFNRWKTMLKEALQAADVVTFDYPCEFVSNSIPLFRIEIISDLDEEELMGFPICQTLLVRKRRLLLRQKNWWILTLTL